MAETENEYLQLVGSDSRMTTDDLKLLFTKDLETYPGWWRYMFGLFIGFFFAGVATINSLK